MEEQQMRRSCTRSLLTLLVLLSTIAAIALPAFAQDAGEGSPKALQKAFPAKRPYSPYADRAFPTRVFFGDTHLHTAYSMDAGAFGARLGPRDAYIFAKGNQVTSNTGQPVKLSRPLDFLVVSDHSDGMGFFPLILAGGPDMMADPQGRKWHDLIASGKGPEAAMDIIVS